MPAPTIPTKTPLGQEELRQRTGGLGQRHRTILFLVDGRRPLAEVLGLAHQAGASTMHFEDLVRLGYVELPPEERPAPPPPLPPEPAAEPEITHLEVVVPPAPVVDETTVEPAPEPAVEPAAEPALAAPRVIEPPAAPSVVTPVLTPVLKPVLKPVLGPVLGPVEPPVLLRTPLVTPPLPPDDEAPLLERARTCLLETLRVDAQPGGPRVAERAWQARSLPELVEVVWLVERGMSHVQRSHRGLLNLQKARELLGLGNTLVDEDSRPSRLEEDDW